MENWMERREKRDRKEEREGGGGGGRGRKDVWAQGTFRDQHVMQATLTSSYHPQSCWSLRDTLSLLQV